LHGYFVWHFTVQFQEEIEGSIRDFKLPGIRHGARSQSFFGELRNERKLKNIQFALKALEHIRNLIQRNWPILVSYYAKCQFTQTIM